MDDVTRRQEITRPNPVIKTIASVIALLTAGILIAAILDVPFRASRPPADEPQPRAHMNTKEQHTL